MDARGRVHRILKGNAWTADELDAALQQSKLFASCDVVFRSAAVPAAASDAGLDAWDCSHTARLPAFLRPGPGAFRVLATSPRCVDPIVA